jgi:hypothetical protein
MFDYITAPEAPELRDDYFRVRDSARRLFERLNPAERDHEIAADAPLLAIYDWEIAKDTELALDEVRTALRLHDGTAIVLGTVNDEHRVVAVLDQPVSYAA